MDSREALIALNLVPEIGPVRLSKLLDYFGEPQEILSASERALMEVRESGSRRLPKFTDGKILLS